MSSQYDNQGQYSRHSILRYEKIFGEGFVSSGGLGLTRSFFDRLELPKGIRVLDIGSGLGGAAFYLAQHYDASVVGVDLSPVMVEIAKERAHHLGCTQVQFHLKDVHHMKFAEHSFDLIWSRDALLHVPEKQTLFSLLLPWLAPGGQIVISDYAQGTQTLSQDFQQYVLDSGYHLLGVEQYGQLLRDSGFDKVRSENWSQQFVEILRAEQNTLLEQREQFLTHFSNKDLDYLVERWERKIRFCHQGDMCTGLWHGWKF